MEAIMAGDAGKKVHTVQVRQVQYYTVDIEADSPEEAQKIAEEACEDGTIEDYDLDHFKSGDFTVIDEVGSPAPGFGKP
jgi:phosphoribosylformylglycinamidine (FGAM) synthase PurS component